MRGRRPGADFAAARSRDAGEDVSPAHPAVVDAHGDDVGDEAHDWDVEVRGVEVVPARQGRRRFDHAATITAAAAAAAVFSGSSAAAWGLMKFDSL